MQEDILEYYSNPSLRNRNYLTKSLSYYVKEQSVIYARANGLNIEYVDDVTQDVMIKLLYYIDHCNLINRSSFISYHKRLIQKIVQSQVVTYLRKYKDLQSSGKLDFIDRAVDSWEEQRTEISDLINQLEPSEQFIFRMKLKGYSDDEIGRSVQCKTTTITKRIQKIRKKLERYYNV